MTPIERAAAAMKDKRRELIAQPLERIWPDLAQVAIAALREPSEGMVADGENAYCAAARDNFKAVWAAGIAAALAEGE